LGELELPYARPHPSTCLASRSASDRPSVSLQGRNFPSARCGDCGTRDAVLSLPVPLAGCGSMRLYEFPAVPRTSAGVARERGMRAGSERCGVITFITHAVRHTVAPLYRAALGGTIQAEQP
jgi:hypothetical protein